MLSPLFYYFNSFLSNLFILQESDNVSPSL